MKRQLFTCLFTTLLAGALLFQCTTEKKEVRLRLKFPPQQVLYWNVDYKKHTSVYEDDSLVVNEDKNMSHVSREEVVEIIDSVKARLKLTSFYEYEKPDKDDSTKKVKVTDTSIVFYVQDDRGVNHDLTLEGKNDSALVEYNLRLYEQLAPRYPDQPISAGYTWSNSVKVMLKNGEINDATTTYRFKAFVREAGYDCAVVEFKGNTIVPYNHTYECGAQDIRIDRRQYEGAFYLAYREGIIIRDEERYTFEAEGMRIKEGRQIDLKIKSEGSYSYYLTKAEGTL